MVEGEPGSIKVCRWWRLLRIRVAADDAARCNALPRQLQLVEAAGIPQGQRARVQLCELAADDVRRRHIVVAAAVQRTACCDLLQVERVHGARAHKHVGAAAHGAQVHALAGAVKVFAQHPRDAVHLSLSNIVAALTLIYHSDNVDAAPVLPEPDKHGAAPPSAPRSAHFEGEGTTPHALGVHALVQHQLHEGRGGHRGSGARAQAPPEQHRA